MFVNDLEDIFVGFSWVNNQEEFFKKIRLKIPFLGDYNVSIKGNNSEKKKPLWEFMKEYFFCLLWMIFSRSQCTHIFHP